MHYHYTTPTELPSIQKKKKMLYTKASYVEVVLVVVQESFLRLAKPKPVQ
jgi:hypothetical protein